VWSNGSVNIETFQPPIVIYPGDEGEAIELDRRFKEDFAGYVGKLSLQQTAYLWRGRSLPPDIKDYELFPITAFNKGFDSTNSMCSLYEKPSHIAVNYHTKGRKLHGDSGLAVGLAYRGQAEAMAAAGLTRKLEVKINQIQAVGPDRSKQDRRDSGLYAGFDWRRTLVNCWEEIAKMAGFDAAVIISALNSPWSAVHGKDDSACGFDRPPAFHAYDDVAKAMHYAQAEPTSFQAVGNWVKEL